MLASAQASRTIRGLVVDAGGHAVAGVNVSVSGGSQATSDDSGAFHIRTDTSLVIFDIKRFGLTPSKFGVRAGHDTVVRITVLEAVQSLDAVDVKAREPDVNGFLERLDASKRGAVRGVFMSAADIAQRGTARATDLFRGLAGVSVYQYSNGRYMLLGRQLVPVELPDGRGQAMAPCAITVYLDGARIGSMKAPTIFGRDNAPAESFDFDALVQATDIQGIEFYDTPHNAPAKFQTVNGGCGIVLIWTKRGGEDRTRPPGA